MLSREVSFDAEALNTELHLGAKQAQRLALRGAQIVERARLIFGYFKKAPAELSLVSRHKARF